MKQLMIMRHAKSGWQDSAATDHDRALNERGRDDAPLMARHMQRQCFIPDHYLASTAARARETLELVLFALEHRPEGRIEKRLYLADPGIILAQIRETAMAVNRLLVVGHNPGLHMLAAGLAKKGDPAALARLNARYPTAALSVIDFDVGSWADVMPGMGTLVDFRVPKDIADH